MSDLQVFEFKPGAQGLYDINATEEIPVGGLLKCTNVWPRDGALRPTLGQALQSTLPGSSEVGLGLHPLARIQNDDSVLFATKPDGLFWTNNLHAASGGWAEVGAYTFGGAMTDAAVINDFLVITNSLVAPIKATYAEPGPPVVAALGGSPPSGARFILNYKGRLLLFNSTAQRNGLYWSTAGLPETWPAANFEPIGADEGQVGSRLVEWNGLAYLWKTGSVWAEVTGDFENPRFERISGSHGTTFPLSLVPTRHGIFFLGGSNIYLYTGGTNFQPIGFPLGQRFERGTFGFGKWKYRQPNVLVSDAVAEYSEPEQLVTLWFNETAGRGWRYDLSRQAWHEVDETAKGFKHYGNGTPFAYYDGAGDRDHNLILSDASRLLTYGSALSADGSGSDGRKYSDQTLKIKTPHIPIREMPNGGPGMEGQLWDVWVKVNNGTGTSISASLLVYRDKASTPETYAFTIASGTYGPTRWQKVANTPGQFRELSLEVQVTMPATQTSNDKFALTDFRVQWEPVTLKAEPR